MARNIYLIELAARDEVYSGTTDRSLGAVLGLEDDKKTCAHNLLPNNTDTPLRKNMMEVARSSHNLQYQSHEGSICDMSDSNTTECSEIVEVVQPDDVLCGRDKQSHAHIGNKNFRKLVLKYRQEYQTAPSREHKTLITCNIVAKVLGYGGRFLKMDETIGKWRNVGDQYAREKVSHALRSAKDPNRPKIKKRREVKKHVPTEEEDRLFETTLADQQQIYESLLEKEGKGMVVDIDGEDLLSLFSNVWSYQ